MTRIDTACQNIGDQEKLRQCHAATLDSAATDYPLFQVTAHCPRCRRTRRALFEAAGLEPDFRLALTPATGCRPDSKGPGPKFSRENWRRAGVNTGLS